MAFIFDKLGSTLFLGTFAGQKRQSNTNVEKYLKDNPHNCLSTEILLAEKWLGLFCKGKLFPLVPKLARHILYHSFPSQHHPLVLAQIPFPACISHKRLLQTNNSVTLSRKGNHVDHTSTNLGCLIPTSLRFCVSHLIVILSRKENPGSLWVWITLTKRQTYKSVVVFF